MEENDYFTQINKKIQELNSKDNEILQDYLGEMEERGLQTIKEILKYITKNFNPILYKTFGTKNKYYLSHYCKYIIEVERYNEWAMAVGGVHTRTFFGWFD